MLSYQGKSFLEHTIDEANNAGTDPVIVVLGSQADRMDKILDQKKIRVVENKEWKEGMASSIRFGVESLLHIAPSADGVIIMVCDQPYVSATLLRLLITTQNRTGNPVVASLYENAIGPPCLFHKSIFPELLELKGDAGARKILQKHTNEMATVLFQEGNIDIDTNDEYNKLITRPKPGD